MHAVPSHIFDRQLSPLFIYLTAEIPEVFPPYPYPSSEVSVPSPLRLSSSLVVINVAPLMFTQQLEAADDPGGSGVVAVSWSRLSKPCSLNPRWCTGRTDQTFSLTSVFSGIRTPYGELQTLGDEF